MSRRKQSNPKPLLKSDCQESAEEMTVERENKDFCETDFSDEMVTSDNDLTEPYSVGSQHHLNTSNSPKNLSNAGETDDDGNKSSFRESMPLPSIITTVTPGVGTSSSIAPSVEESRESIVPKLRLNVSLASDPALKPDAKDVKMIHAEATAAAAIAAAAAANSNSVHEDSKGLSGGTEDESIDGRSRKSPVLDIPARIQIFMCHPCGIRFSSLSTLEAHQTYYCSHRKDVEEETTTNDVLAVESSSTGEPSAKSIKTGKQYACTHCSYSADKKVSLNRHMRMHQSSPAPSSNTSNGGDEGSSQQVDRYCSECDIRFSNIKTYRAHKQHYCSSRRLENQNSTTKTETNKKSGSASPQERSRTPAAIAPPQPFLALPTNPILIIPYALISAANLLPGPLTSLAAAVENPDITCFSLENGSLQPVATMLTTLQTSKNSSSRIQSSLQSNTSLLTEKNNKIPPTEVVNKTYNKKENSSRESAPLDLSVKKSVNFRHQRPRSDSTIVEEARIDIEKIMEGKENLSIGTAGRITPEHIVCAPSIPNSPTSLTPSPKRRTASPRSGSVSVSPGPIVSSNHNLIRSFLPPELAIKLAESNLAPLLNAQKQNAEIALKLNSLTSSQITNNNKVVIDSNSSSSLTAAATVAAATAAIVNLQNTPLNVVPAIPSVQPQIYLKQGVCKCKECNIVFCKYENYLAHKQHYCSSRNQEDPDKKIHDSPPLTAHQNDNGTASTGSGSVVVVNNSGAGVSSSSGGSNAGTVGGNIGQTYHQLICGACGIKYTSLDNLRAHQTFYCPKGGGSGGDIAAAAAPISVSKEKCIKCKLIHEISQQCPITTQSSYKCPVCDFISLNAAECKKHMESHGSVKAFRCSICRYKGNTLRGMRTHIRMHFDKKSTDFNEEKYMSCIEEDGNEIQTTTVPVTIPPLICQDNSVQLLQQQQSLQSTTPQQSHQQLQQQQQQLFKCDICSYSSSYKGNVIRHVKLMHSQSSGSPSSVNSDLGEGGESLFQNGDADKANSDQNHVIIKVEPIDSKIPNDEIKEISNNSTLTVIKKEPEDNNIVTNNANPGIISSNDTTTGKTTTSNAATISNNTGSKYCQTCNINFKQVSTYMAHKQFYCKSTRQDVIKDPSMKAAASTTIPSPSQSPSHLNKHKESLESIL